MPFADSPPRHPTIDENEQLRDALRRCPAPTLEAALEYRRTGDTRHVPTLVAGLVTRFVEPELRPRLQDPADDLRLSEDLGLDSLSLMEMVLLAEDVLRISISSEELRALRTLGDVKQFAVGKARGDFVLRPDSK